MSHSAQNSEPLLVSSARTTDALRNAGLVLAATVFVAVCAHIAVPVSLSPVPFTLQPFAVLFVAFLLGPALGATTMVAYVLEGAAGLPVFAPGVGGVAQIVGPTGGFLMAYPLVAWIAGTLYGSSRTFIRGVVGGTAGIAILFTAGVVWFSTVLHLSLANAFAVAALPYIASDLVKVCAAAGIASAIHRARR